MNEVMITSYKSLRKYTIERGDALDGELRGIVVVVDDDDVEAALEELEDSVAADVVGAVGDPNVLHHD